MKVGVIKKMDARERQKKLEELQMELVKSRINSSKGGTGKIREIKKTIAQILTMEEKK